MSDGPATERAPGDGETFDVFVSYAHADDEVPRGADSGWVTALVGELQKVLRRKLGGSGAKVWMDHQLAANQPVTHELLQKVASSRTLLLVLSPGYRQSAWCQRELANFVARASARGETQSVFPIEIEPLEREDLPPSLASLTPIRFWEWPADQRAPKLAGYPRPKPDEDSLYWSNVNDLAHIIAKRLRVKVRDGNLKRRTTVVLAEVTDDLDGSRQLVESSLMQRGDVVVLPAGPYPRGSETDFLASVRSDLRDAAMFVQLLGPHMGKLAPGSAETFVAMQTQEALGRDLRVMQWRSPALELDSVANPAYREMLSGQHVLAVGLEEFRRLVLRAIDEFGPLQAAPIRRVSPTLTTRTRLDDGEVLADGLSLYLQAAPEDRESAELIADRLAGVGANVQLSPETMPGQSFLHGLMAQEEALRLCDGVLLVYGRSPVNAISAAFQYALRVFGVKRPGVWSAVLDLPPAKKQRVPIRSPNLMTIECHGDFDPTQLGGFFNGLRASGVARA